MLSIYANESLTRKQRIAQIQDLRRTIAQDRARYELEKRARIEKAHKARQIRVATFARQFSPTAHYVDGQNFADKMVHIPGKANLVVQASPWVTRDVPVTLVQPSTAVYGAGYSTAFPSPRTVNNRLIAEVKLQAVNLAMMLAEYRQTASMFQDSAFRLFQIGRDLKRGRFSAAKRLRSYGPSGAANDWLMYRYGVTPLLGDLNGIDKWLSGEYVVPVIKRFKVYEGKLISETRSQSSFVNGLGTKFFASQKYETKSQQVAWVEYDTSYFKTFNQAGLTNPLLLGWEMIPFSFIVDWFVQVGSYLETLDALQGVKRIAITRAVKYKSSVYHGSEHVGTATRYLRSVITPGSITRLTYEPSISAKRVVDSVALLSQLIKR